MNHLEAVLLCVPDGYHCVDLSLYKVIYMTVLFTFVHLQQAFYTKLVEYATNKLFRRSFVPFIRMMSM